MTRDDFLVRACETLAALAEPVVTAAQRGDDDDMTLERARRVAVAWGAVARFLAAHATFDDPEEAPLPLAAVRARRDYEACVRQAVAANLVAPFDTLVSDLDDLARELLAGVDLPPKTVARPEPVDDEPVRPTAPADALRAALARIADGPGVDPDAFLNATARLGSLDDADDLLSLAHARTALGETLPRDLPLAALRVARRSLAQLEPRAAAIVVEQAEDRNADRLLRLDPLGRYLWVPVVDPASAGPLLAAARANAARLQPFEGAGTDRDVFAPPPGREADLAAFEEPWRRYERRIPEFERLSDGTVSLRLTSTTPLRLRLVAQTQAPGAVRWDADPTYPDGVVLFENEWACVRVVEVLDLDAEAARGVDRSRVDRSGGLVIAVCCPADESGRARGVDEIRVIDDAGTPLSLASVHDGPGLLVRILRAVRPGRYVVRVPSLSLEVPFEVRV